MSSTVLLDRLKTYLRSQFTEQEVRTLDLYGGQFNADEVDFKSYACPAVFLAVRGWRPFQDGKHLAGQHVRGVELSAFVLTKHAGSREGRMQAAMVLSERLALALERWQPDNDEAASALVDIAPLEEDATCENLYSRAIDKAGQALWVVHWLQCMEVRSQGQLWDLLRVQADSLARAQEPAPAVTQPTAPLDVAAGVQFAEVPFNNNP